MIRVIRHALVCSSLLAVAACGSTPDSGHTTSGPRKHITVQFTDMSVHPSRAQLLPGGNVSWVNYASEAVGVVFFPDSSIDGFKCSDLRPIFAEVAGGWQSTPITREGMDNVRLPCALKPGTYAYELRLGEAMTGMGEAAFSNPTNVLHGEIVAQ
jgi:hypothetical protein